VSSGTKPAERDRIIESFKDGVTKIVFNVGVLTTGFDMPELDCIVLLRPTKSVALYYQMLGRGVRIAPGKTHCTVVDMSDCMTRIGGVESIKLEKVDNKWNVTTSAQPKGWHGVQLYKVKIKDLPPQAEQQPIF
jgi:DNA repair protein RadD